ncbi:unnamed protein product [Clonostachys rosea]|uniref:Nudix hydrolase domain-containing protein n=1 Tax=Bionectria ochroleuca TaxID=29856 RepID=A0ABY6UFA8_BIOOC|nr:unnamed protein product [Clonostachys rosea]
MAQPAPAPSAPLDYQFTFDDELAQYAKPLAEWHQLHDNKYSGLVAGAIVFDAHGRVLILRRAAHDYLPGLWEPPGGSVDPTDQSLLHACVRELWEEAGLRARRVICAVGQGNDWTAGSKLFHRYTLLIEADEGEVRTDPEEHSEWKWATREEVSAERMEDGTLIPMTFPITKETLLEGIILSQAHQAAKGMV